MSNQQKLIAFAAAMHFLILSSVIATVHAAKNDSDNVKEAQISISLGK